MSNIPLIAMLLFFLVPAIIFKQYFLALTFIIFGMIFGFVEFLADFYTGKTVSQHIWKLGSDEPVKVVVLITCLLLAWICLLIHFAVGIKKVGG